MKNLIFRADGNSKIGLGHIYRLLAFSELVSGNYKRTFVVDSQSPTKQFEGKIDVVQIPEMERTEEIKWLFSHFDPMESIIVLDGYDFDNFYQEKLRNANYRFIYIDDLNQGSQLADVVVNHAVGLKTSDYNSTVGTRFALGSDYALLRPEFHEAIQKARSVTNVSTALVCFGGADPLGLTGRMINILSKLDFIDTINVILGSANRTFDDAKIDGIQINTFVNLSAPEMIAVMQSSDIAIAPSSTISYELCCCQTPVLSGFYIDNQELIYKGLNAAGAIYGIGDFREVSDNQIKAGLLELSNQDQLNAIVINQRKLFRKPVSDNISKLVEELC